MVEAVLAGVILALLVERFVSERRHHRERMDLLRVAVSRVPGAAARQGQQPDRDKPEKVGRDAAREPADFVPLGLK